ncbi:MAG: GUN4 domain-containing protein [Phormidium sp. PBR-2020]|nr:MAG: GUN4 domain-containing protein [Phormidium sp. PBR-2020]
MDRRFWKKMVGEQFNHKYHLVQFIDSGSFGGVFLANEVIADRVIRQVALKIFLVETSQLDLQIAELRLATRLKHPHLLDCYSSEVGFEDEEDEEEKYLGLAMEPATESLSQYLAKRETLPPQEVRNIIGQIASALVFLHSQNIVHRDLKPGNILRVGEVWKVADFGISRVLTQGTSTKTTQQIGTPVYQPPESYQGEIRPGWDVWSLGILLQEMLTGTHPFSANTITGPQLMMKVMMQEPEFPEGLSDEFLTIVKGCLVKNPKERWTAQQVLDAVQPRQETLPSIDQLDLSSKRAGINYYKLRDLLAAKCWGDADQETAERMCEVMGRAEEGWLRVEDIEQFPCKDLKIIDTLWVHYSQGEFGFSVQKKIWIECGSPTSYNDDWFRFCDRVGWSEGGEFLSYHRIIKKVGHASLPCLADEGLVGLVGLFSRATETLASIDQLDLSSERPGINYYELRVLLAAKKWEKADQETAKRMFEVMGRAKDRWLRPEDIERFPCKDLKIIDKLWVHYSQGEFGFSVQNEIWVECGSPKRYNDDWKRFGERVGWREGGEWISYKRIEKSKAGSLPVLGWRGGWEFERSFIWGSGCACFSSLAQRLAFCIK